MPLIVLEGLDGAGKSTQLELLRRWAAEKGYRTEFLHFPRFDTPLYGEFIARFLRGEFGCDAAGGAPYGQGNGPEGAQNSSTDPYTLALMFAGDRAQAAPGLRSWLDAGKWVFLDRYVWSNVAYQCAKVDDPAERERLKRWILQLEYEIYGIPRPDVSIFLDVPLCVTGARLKNQREGADRDYLNGGKDVHESSPDLQRRVREVYLEAAETDPALKIVDCAAPENRDTPPGAPLQKSNTPPAPSDCDFARQMLSPAEIFALIKEKFIYLP